MNNSTFVEKFNFSLKEELILIKEQVNNKEEIIQKLGALLYNQNFVKKSYINAILEREKAFPTGISTKVTGVAIPHTDSIHVNKSAIAIATLNTPVVFEAMGYPGKVIDNVEIVMMLAVMDPKKVMDVIRLISKTFTSESMLNSLLCASNARDLKNTFLNNL